jgi:mono/diheme cytochrome c family protein
MSEKTVFATIARGLVLGGFLLSLLGGRGTLLGGEPSALKNVTLRGLNNDRIKLSVPTGGATVLIFYSSECPISNAYSPTLQELIGKYQQRPVEWVGICVDPDLSDSEVKTHASDFKLGFRIARDPIVSFARRIGATVTPEAFVLDDKGQVRYHGRIDDQFVARRVRNAVPSGNELREAIAAVLNGKEVAVAHVAAVGCPIPEAPAAIASPTYSKDVAPILQQNCQECHRRGQVGPFPLESYEQARKRAPDIASVVEGRAMPPWKASPHFGVKFKDARVLSEKDIATIVAWSDAGASEGDPHDLPTPRKFPDDWQLGTPDFIVDIGTDFQVPASGDDIYRCFVIPTKFDKDLYVTAIEYRPGNRSIVHHLLTYVDVSGGGRKRDEADPGPGYSCFSGPGEPIHGDLGGWAPGNPPSVLPDGIGRSLPRGADIIVQIHYHPSGKAETDRSRIGLHFSRKPIRQTLHWTAAADLGMQLPAGNSNVEIKAAWPVPVDLVAHAVTPHMHLLGHDIAMSITFPDGRVQDLIKIDDWDFNWQYSYFFEKPMDLPKGSVLNVVAHYDNSASNPHNPNKPPKLVKWGEATTDEMCVGFLAVTKKGQDLTRPGEKDDLMEIFQKMREEYMKRRETEKQKSQQDSQKKTASTTATQ